MDNDLRQADTGTLRNLADGLKADMKAIQHTNRAEALRLVQVYKKITQELHRRRNPAVISQMN